MKEYTTTEAARIWGKATSTLRCSIKFGRLKPHEVRKPGRDWLISHKGMVRLYGEPKNNTAKL